MTLEYNELTETQREELMVHGMNLMRTVAEIYGPEQGMELWDVIATQVGQDFKGACFFNMLTGQFQGDIHVSKVNENKYVESIKAIRTVSGYGLKEAKDFCDEVRGSSYGVGKVKKLPVQSGIKRHEAVKLLRDVGCVAQ
jgi:ribosomal protein L7/L12